MTPPRVADWILRRRIPRGAVGDSILGDLFEEYRSLPPGWRRDVWYCWQAVSLPVSYRRRMGRRALPVAPGGVGRDVRHAIRMMRKRPAFSTLAVATLALGIGATTAIVSVVDRVLLRTLPFPDPHQLVTVWNIYPDWEGHEVLGPLWNRIPLSYPEYADWRPAQESFVDVAIYGMTRMTLTGAGDPTEVGVGITSASLFPLLGVSPAMGRTFREDEIGDGAARVAVMSHRLWTQRFGAAGDILTRTLTLNGSAYEIIGVLPRDFRLRSLGVPGETIKDVWIPAGILGDVYDRGQHTYEAFGRLRPGVTVEQASAEAAALLPGPRRNRQTAWAVSRQVEETGEVRGVLLLLLGSVTLLLLIAGVNVATLFLAEATNRRREIEVRAALGASRAQLVGQLVAESAVIGVFGAVVGLGVAVAGVRALLALAPVGLPLPSAIPLDLRILGFATVLGVLSGVIFGVGPAIAATGGRVGADTGRTTAGHAPTQRTQRSMVVVESALSVVLLIVAGLLGRSLLAMRAVDPGFEQEHVYVAPLLLPSDRTPDAESVVRFISELSERVGAVPGVTSVSAANIVPFSGRGGSSSFTIEGRPPGEGTEQPEALRRAVFGDFHRQLGIPVLSGRTITPEDRSGAPGVVVVSESMAERFWPGESPIGQYILRDRRRWEVVGVVGDILNADLTAATQSTFYFPFAQQPTRRVSLLVRTTLPLETLAPELRRIVWAAAPELPLDQVEPLGGMVARSTAGAGYRTVLVAAFALCAVLLAGVGIVGVTTRAVGSRRRELGVRVALGSTPSAVVGAVVGREWRGVAVGVLVGVFGAWFAAGLVESFLFGVSPRDPVTFVGAAVLLVGVGGLAGYVPARRAAAVDPADVLRE